MGPWISSETFDFDDFWWKPIRTTTRACLAGALFFQKKHVPGFLGPVYVISLILDMKKTRKVISRRLDRVSARNLCSRPLSWRFLFWPENHENAGFVCVCGWARMSLNLPGLRRVCQVCVVTSILVYAVIDFWHTSTHNDATDHIYRLGSLKPHFELKNCFFIGNGSTIHYCVY